MSSKRRVYMDYAATTPVDPRVAAAMAECLTRDGVFGNPSSTGHSFGAQARSRVEQARKQVAALIGAEAAAIVWTSGATEADNLAVLGAARFHARRGKHIVTARTEHKAVLDACKQLEKEGFSLTYLKPDTAGLIHVEQVAAALTPATVLVSIMHVNNEIGVIQDIGSIGALCREREVLFHVDAAQSAGKIPIDVHAQCVDLLSLTAHKFYGPKGIGALYVRRRPRVGLTPLIFGGGQESGLRSGTLATHQIVGMGTACALAAAEMASDANRIEILRDRLWAMLGREDGVLLNGEAAPRIPHVLNLSFEGVEGESLLFGLNGLAVSTGSACNSASQESSYVLRALGRSDALAQGSLRFSLGRFSTESDVDFAAESVSRQLRILRELSPASLAPAAEDLIQGEAGSVESGVWVRFQLKIGAGRVTDARFQAYGCPHTVAAASWLAEHLPGRAVTDLLPEGAAGLAQQLEVPVEKLGRLLTLEDALHDCRRRWSNRGVELQRSGTT